MGKHRLLLTALALLSSHDSAWSLAQPQAPVPAPPAGMTANVCHLDTSRSSGGAFDADYNSSAVLYRGQYLITAAHNVFSPFYRRLVNLRVACGLAEPTAGEHVAVDSSNVRVACGYRWFPKRYSRDFAVVRLPTPIAMERPLVLRSIAPGEALPEVRIAGFPWQRGERAGMNGRRLFAGAGPARVIRKSRIQYEVMTYTGNSGGPVWIEEADGPRLVGIHVAGKGPRGRARMVDDYFVDQVHRMIASFDQAGPHCN